MPKGQYENIDIYEAALSCVALFEETKNVKITVEAEESRLNSRCRWRSNYKGIYKPY